MKRQLLYGRDARCMKSSRRFVPQRLAKWATKGDEDMWYTALCGNTICSTRVQLNIEDTRHIHMWLKPCDDVIASGEVGGQPQCAPVDNLAVWQLLV